MGRYRRTKSCNFQNFEEVSLYDFPGSEVWIEILGIDYDEIMILNKDIFVHLEGGFDGDYSWNPGISKLEGIEIWNGCVHPTSIVLGP